MFKWLTVLCSIFLLAHSCQKRCQSGWTQINRTEGEWCIKVVAVASAGVTQAEATAKCTAQNAVLSSTESPAETNTVGDLLRAQDLQVGFLGSKLDDYCECTFSSTVFTCPDTRCDYYTAYVWTDNFTNDHYDATAYMDVGNSSDWIKQYLVTFGENTTVDGGTFDSGLIGWTDGEPGNEDYTAGAVCGRQPE